MGAAASVAAAQRAKEKKRKAAQSLADRGGTELSKEDEEDLAEPPELRPWHLISRIIIDPEAHKIFDKKKRTSNRTKIRFLEHEERTIRRAAADMHNDSKFLQHCFLTLCGKEGDSRLALKHNEENAQTARLSREQLRLWIRVMSYDEEPTDEELDDCYEKVKENREATGRQVVDEMAECLSFEDFLAIVIDFYLSMGTTHMRHVFTDLLQI